MANIRIDLKSSLHNGQQLTFRSPKDCSGVTGLKIYYPEGESETSKTFLLADAHGNNVENDNLFAENVLVKVILDTELERAYVQNADTNKYIEDTFLKKHTDTVCGLKGFYWEKIEATGFYKLPDTATSEHGVQYSPTGDIPSGASRFYKITLSTKNGEHGVEQDFTASDYFAVGDVISIHNNAKYYNCTTVSTAYSLDSDNVPAVTKPGKKEIWVRGLPFTSWQSQTDHFTDNGVYCLAKPEAGLVDFGAGSVAFGVDSRATNYGATAFGRDNNAYGQYAFVAGRENEGGHGVAVFGRANKVSGEQSFTTGYKNNVPGNNSFVAGRENEVFSRYALCAGLRNIVVAEGQTIVGMYNRPDLNILFAVGSGSGEEEAHRANAFEVRKNGETVGNRFTCEGNDSFFPRYRFTRNGEEIGYIQQSPLDAGRNFQFIQRAKNSNKNEIYNLPVPSVVSGNSSKYYDILTTKNSFGLGGGAQQVAWKDADTITANGWYLFSELDGGILDLGYITQAIMRVDAFNNGFAVQTVYPLTTLNMLKVIRQRIPDQGWGDWEWENPPMQAGVEYRTTERWRGNPVYTKLINCGDGPNQTVKSVAHGTAIAQVLRTFGACSNGANAGGIKGVTSYLSVWADKNNVYLSSPADQSATKIDAQMFYTKP